MLTHEIQKSIDESILCWLATCDNSGQPNVSPKEVFLAEDTEHILIANIASPKSISNIYENKKVCVSFVHIFKQKGYKLYGVAQELTHGDSQYAAMHKRLYSISGEPYPIQSIIRVKIESTVPIIAPSYFLLPDESEAKKIEYAKRNYLK